MISEATPLIAKSSQPKLMRGQRFEKSSLVSDLENAIFGQNFSTQILVLIGLGLLVFILALLVGNIGGLVGAWITISVWIDAAKGLFILALCVVIPLFVWISFAISSNFAGSLLAAFLALICIFLGLSFGLLEVVPDGLIKEKLAENNYTNVISLAVVGLVFSIASFYANRLAIATAKILLPNPRFVYLLGVGAIAIALFISGLSASYDVFQDPWTKPSIEQLQSEDQQSLRQMLGFVTPLLGITYGLILCLGAWWANQRGNVPWEHPDLFRTLALILGSWRGTSFHQLDLSGVSLRGAKLANTDLRARKLYRTCFLGAMGLERARVDNRYCDLEVPKVQTLLTQGSSSEIDYNRLNLRGAYLQGADLRRMSFSDSDLSGADLNGADLRGAILARTQAIAADFSNANLTGACIQDWSVNSETNFSNVLCDYVYRELDEKGEPIDRYPADRNFEPQEFESLYQEIGNVAELVFKEGINWRAFSFSMQKLDLEDEGMGLELKGFERRGDRWVVRVTHNQYVPKQDVERRLTDMYEDMKGLLAAKEEQINKLLGIASDQAVAMSDQAFAIKEFSQKPFGNSFFIVGSTITNLSGSGNIEYTEAATQVREIVAHGSDRKQAAPFVKQFVQQMKQQDVAITGTQQLELMQQLMLAEAEADPDFRAQLLSQGPAMIQAMAGTPLVKVIGGAIAQLSSQ